MLTGLVGITGAASTLMSAKKLPNPPAAEIPAVGEPVSKTPGAIVRIGNKAGSNTDANTPDDQNPFVFKRVAATTLGGLGGAASGTAL